MEDWYNISADQVRDLGGDRLLRQYYNNSLVGALVAVYPEVDWQPWRFQAVPRGFWEDLNHQRKFFDWVAQQLKIVHEDQWYDVNADDLRRLGGQGLLNQHYNGSLINALESVYPEIEWKPWRFRMTPRGFWKDLANQRRFFDWAATQLGVHQTPDDWYKIHPEDIRRLPGGDSLLREYNKSLPNALLAVYPEAQWLPWKFETVPKHFWDNIDNQRKFFDWAASQLFDGIRGGGREAGGGGGAGAGASEDHWYRASANDIRELPGGKTLLANYYGDSLVNALRAVYPEVAWESWRFESCRVPKQSFGDDPASLKRYFEFLSHELNIRHLDEWYRVSLRQVYQFGGGHSVLRRNGGLYTALKKAYPKHNWARHKFQLSRGKKSSQRWLAVILHKMFPQYEVVEEFLHSELRFGDSEERMQFDVFIPQLSLAFEYHGEHHYKDLHFFGSQSSYHQRDIEKALTCRAAGITLVAVPHWWDGTVETLAESICDIRPDLASLLAAKSTTNNNATDESASSTSSKPPLIMPGTWSSATDPTGWWMSEKLDGIRVFWDGERLVTQHGRVVNAPKHFTEALPSNFTLDGQLWIGRGMYQEINGIVRSSSGSSSSHCNGSRSNQSSPWNLVKFVVFDAPSIEGDFETRLHRLSEMWQMDDMYGATDRNNNHNNSNTNSNNKKLLQPDHVHIAKVERCDGPQHLQSYLTEIVGAGGEGVLLRAPNSPYIATTSDGEPTNLLLEVKPQQASSVKFIRVDTDSRGLICEQANGQHIVVGCSNRVLASPPAPGAVITVTHYGYWNSGKLRYSYFVGGGALNTTTS